AFQERYFVFAQMPAFSQFTACSESNTGQAAAAWSLPFQRHSLRDETFYGFGHVREPAGAPQLSIGEDVDSDLALFVEGVGDRAVLLFTQVIDGKIPFGVGGAGLQQFRGTQQTSDLFCTVAHSRFF